MNNLRKKKPKPFHSCFPRLLFPSLHYYLWSRAILTLFRVIYQCVSMNVHVMLNQTVNFVIKLRETFEASQNSFENNFSEKSMNFRKSEIFYKHSLETCKPNRDERNFSNYNSLRINFLQLTFVWLIVTLHFENAQNFPLKWSSWNFID